MSSYNAFFGQITIDDDNDDITVDSTPVLLTQGDYYIYSPVPAESLLDMLCTQISTESAAEVSYAISESGILTLSSSSAFALEFGSTLYEVLGFDHANLTSATSQVATYQLQLCWFPEQLDSGHLAPTSSAGKNYPVVSQQQASDGNVWTTKYGTITKQSLTYRYLEKAKIWQAATADNSSWEEFFESTYSEGKKILFVPGWPDDESVYWYYVADLKGNSAPEAKQSITGSDAFWEISISFMGVDA